MQLALKKSRVKVELRRKVRRCDASQLSRTHQETTMTRQELTILRHTDYRCHGCWQDLRLLPQTRWRMLAMPAKNRGSQQKGEHLLAVCEQCAWPMALAIQPETPMQPVEVQGIPLLSWDRVLDREDTSLTAGALGLLSGWFIAGPVLALIGLGAGAIAGYLLARTGGQA